MTKKTRIEIALPVPTVPDAHYACVQRLGDLLRDNDGIEAAHFPRMNGKVPSQICFHDDRDRLLRQQTAFQNLAFSVWQAFTEHRRLGGVNRVQRWASPLLTAWRCQPTEVKATEPPSTDETGGFG